MAVKYSLGLKKNENPVDITYILYIYIYIYVIVSGLPGQINYQQLLVLFEPLLCSSYKFQIVTPKVITPVTDLHWRRASIARKLCTKTIGCFIYAFLAKIAISYLIGDPAYHFRSIVVLQFLPFVYIYIYTYIYIYIYLYI